MNEMTLPDGWVSVIASDSFSVLSTIGKAVKTKDTLQTGRFPVVDQGQSFISGYLDDETKVVKVNSPVLLFGDHTRIIKWIDFDFVPGADGTKLLQPLNFLNSRYAYYHLQQLDIPDKGYSRHFKFFKELAFYIPSLAEQKVIADQLDTLLAQVERTKARLERVPDILKQFRQSVLAAAVSGKLTEGWREEHKCSLFMIQHDKKLPYLSDKDYYIDDVEGWIWTRFGSVVNLINGDRGKNYPNQSEYVKIGIPFINTGHIEPNGTLSENRMNFISKEKYDTLGGGKTRSTDLVYCLRGATIGKTAYVRYEVGAIASSLVIVRCSEKINKEYAYIFLVSPISKNLIKEFDNGSAQPNLSAKSLASFPLQIPPLEEQTEIVRRVETLFTHADKIEQQAQAGLARVNQLAQSILAKAFRGELTAQWRKDNPELISGENSAEALLVKIAQERGKLGKQKSTKRKIS